MSKRYTYSRTIDTHMGKETFTAQEFDSFDEAITAVNKGIYERELFLNEQKKKLPANVPTQESTAGGASGNSTTGGGDTSKQS